ncbi:MAG: ABC transporter permease [Anaerolineae bacterium]|nr:ABC transporter permease [Anaerolineae bacterium]MCB0204177.1 ABC transporter permease [Anaerolineae bacterium]
MSVLPESRAAAASRGQTPSRRAGRRWLAPRWAKVMRDLWDHKSRTILVVLSIAVGVFAVGMIAGTRQILDHQMNTTYQAINPADAMIGVTGFDADMLAAVQRMPEVGSATARFNLRSRASLGPGQWLDLSIFALPDWENIPLNIVRPESGPWPPPRDAIVVERMSLPMLKANVGDTVSIELPDGRTKDVTVIGTAHDINLPPARFTNQAFAYTTFDTLERWGYPKQYTTLSFRVADQAGHTDKAYIQSVADKVKEKIESSGRTVTFTYVPDPGKHPADAVLTPVFLLLGVLGLLSLFLSAFLVINTIAAVMAQQVRQIGVMKTIGASVGQITWLYLGMVLIFGLLALLIAVPASVAGAYGFTDFLSQFINFDVVYEGVPLTAIALQVLVGLLVPLVAALWPISNGARVTIREAISNYGLGQGRFGQGFVDRTLVNSQHYLPWISRPLVISLRNTFRRKGRLALTMLTLTLGGAIFVAVLSVRASLYQTVDDAVRNNNFHVVIGIDRDVRTDALQNEALQVPGVVAAESWGRATARRQRPDAVVGSASENGMPSLPSRSGEEGVQTRTQPGLPAGESDEIRIHAPPAGSQMLRPQIISGRWLLPEDENALVVDTTFMDAENDVRVGDTITLKIDGKESDWVVVGVMEGVLDQPTGYANYDYFSRLMGRTGRASVLRVLTNSEDPAVHRRVAAALEQRFQQAGYTVTLLSTRDENLEGTEYQFGILVNLLLVMTFLMALVGGLGLMGTMSINVIERTREIGVMRAIGAATRSIMQIITVEGVLIGFISWIQATVLAYPLSRVLSDQVGMAFTNAPLSFAFSAVGILIWLVIVIAVAALASYLPARNASRLTVREVLAYE